MQIVINSEKMFKSLIRYKFVSQTIKSKLELNGSSRSTEARKLKKADKKLMRFALYFKNIPFENTLDAVRSAR